MHYNHSFLTYGNRPRQLVLTALLGSEDGEPPLFLEDSLEVNARQLLTRHHSFAAKAHLRLAALLRSSTLDLVYTARLTQRPEPTSHGTPAFQLCSQGLLTQTRDTFDATGQQLIDNLARL